MSAEGCVLTGMAVGSMRSSAERVVWLFFLTLRCVMVVHARWRLGTGVIHLVAFVRVGFEVESVVCWNLDGVGVVVMRGLLCGVTWLSALCC